MLRAVVSDFVRAISRRRNAERAGNDAAQALGNLRYVWSVSALAQVQVSADNAGVIAAALAQVQVYADNAGGIAAAITQFQLSNRYIPSAFKAFLSRRSRRLRGDRYQTELHMGRLNAISEV
jgi:hypothetical protein